MVIYQTILLDIENEDDFVETIKVGIDRIGLFVPKYYMDMKELATHRGIDPNKWTIGIGQDKMAVPTQVTDVVAMAANAAEQILTTEDKQLIDQVIVGSESGVDFSKSIATFVHQMLEIQPNVKAFEIKQACYGATAALQMACDYVRLRPERKVLVIATDIAKYGLESAGEPTQGAGAVAMLISANPRIISIDFDSYTHTNHQFDFWRPNYSDYALVDGHFSTQLYQDEFIEILKQVEKQNRHQLTEIEAMVFHLPFTKMGKKALNAYRDVSQDEVTIDRWESHYDASRQLNRNVGNIYTGSLFLSLLSLLLEDKSLNSKDKIGLFSYGSGAVAELVIGELQDDYQQFLNREIVQKHFNRREAISVAEYEQYFKDALNSGEGQTLSFDPIEEGYYLKEIENARRLYDKA